MDNTNCSHAEDITMHVVPRKCFFKISWKFLRISKDLEEMFLVVDSRLRTKDHISMCCRGQGDISPIFWYSEANALDINEECLLGTDKNQSIIKLKILRKLLYKTFMKFSQNLNSFYDSNKWQDVVTLNCIIVNKFFSFIK